MSELTQMFVYFGLYFLTYFFQLIYWSILAWVILTWVILLGGMKPSNTLFQFLSRLVEPVLKPFAWARLGAVDLSPVVAIVALGYLANFFQRLLLQLV